LELEVDVLGAEYPHEVVRVRPRLPVTALDEPGAEARSQTTGERDDPLAVAIELLGIHGGLAALQPVEEAGRGQLDEVAIALAGLGQQREMVALASTSGRTGMVVDEIDLAADDGLDPMAAAGLVELHGSVHHPVIGEAEGGLVELRGAGREGLDP